MRLSCMLVLILATLSGKAIAENGCPNAYQPMGVYEQGPSKGYPICAPIPGYYDQDEEAKDPQPSLPPVSWGSIAVDPAKQVTGFSKQKKSERQAHREAIKECKAKGGGGCGIAMTYHSAVYQCVGMAVGENGKFGAARAGTKGEALYLALETCKAQGVKCEVYYANCLF